MNKEAIHKILMHNRMEIAAHQLWAHQDRIERENEQLRKENEELRKEVADLKERWRKTHEPSELRVQLERALSRINEMELEAKEEAGDWTEE